MKLFEESTHVFIVRIWEEPREGEHLKLIWRGVVEDLSTQDRRYFDSMRTLYQFIQEKSGIGPEETLG